ncbi:MAG TPA: rhodanese-like domain-containing protein [Bryobacteraceae bacterium]|nr:rhodanese-like domain-containing protein [Bryobacteraceae bacterium]
MSDLSFEVCVAEVKRRLNAGEPLHLIDVRQPEEHAVAHIDPSRLVPMGEVPQALPELESKADEGTLIVFCHHGVRSANVVQWLRGQGVTECQSMGGGIDAWSLEVDPSVPRY